MRLHIVDVFAETRYAGNQLAVVRDCAGLSDEAMQTIAREMNFSETTFVTAESPTRAKVRIFTPGEELPFAGHPTIGTAWVLGHTRPSFTLELALGDVDVSFDGAAGVAWMTPPKPTLGERFPGRTCRAHVAARRLPISIRSCRRNSSRSARSSCSSAFAISRRCAARGSTKRTFHACRAEGLPINSVFLFAPQAYSDDAHYAARLFFDANGVREDPATGSANSGFAAYLHAHLKKPIDVIVEQGFEIKRPSRLYLRADAQQLRVGGRVQAVSEGRLLEV